MNSTISPGQHARSFHKTISKTVSMNYLLYLPREYVKENTRWPMILFLHGAGERGDDLELVKKHGPPKIAEEKEDFPFIVVSPQCPEGNWWERENLIALLDEIVANYDIDEERIYLTGLNMGGFGTWDLAARYPERFAAIAPVCGGGIPPTTRKLVDVPVWVFHGALDETVPLKYSEDMVNALKKFEGNVKFTVYPEAKHDSWTETYDNPELYKWFLRHRKTKH